MHSILFHEEVWGGVFWRQRARQCPYLENLSKIYRKSIENPLLINVSPCTIPHLRDNFKFRADSEQASFYASSNRMMSRGRLKDHPDIIMWGEACIINKYFLYKARWHRRSVSNPSPILLQSFSDPSPILLRSFSDPSPILLQPFSNPSPIPPNPPQVLLHPCN